jgi:hypothetical protein
MTGREIKKRKEIKKKKEICQIVRVAAAVITADASRRSALREG